MKEKFDQIIKGVTADLQTAQKACDAVTTSVSRSVAERVGKKYTAGPASAKVDRRGDKLFVTVSLELSMKDREEKAI